MKNIYRIVAKFEYNNNKYFITMVNDDKIVIVKYDANKNISTNFSNEEYELLNTVYNSLLIDKEQSVYIEDLDVNQNKYKIYYDPNSKNYFWDLINGKHDEECNKYLNFKYNHMTGTYYLSKENNEEEKSEEKLEQLLKNALKELNELTSKTEQKVETLKNTTKLEGEKEEEKHEDNNENTDETIVENDNELISIRPEEIEELNQATAKENKLEFKLEVDEDGETIESVIQKAIQAVRKKKAKDKKIKELNEVIDELNEIKNHGSRVEVKLKISEDKETVESILQKAIEAVKEKIERIENGNFTEEQDLEQELEQEEQISGEAKEEKNIENEIAKQENVEDYTNKDERKEDEIETKKYYRKLVKFKKIIIPIMVSTTMLLAPIVDASILGAQGKKEEKVGKNSVITTYKKSKDYNFADIEENINSNENLTDKEKEFIKKFKIVFDEDYQYMDLDLVENRLNTLKINYKNENEDGNTLLAGTYNELTNEITMNKSEKFEDVSKADFSHELFHVFQEGSHRYIMELINEGYKREKLRQMKDKNILGKEYFEDNTQSYANFGNGYADHIYIYYVLASMLDEESIKEYQYTCDDKIIVSKLCQIDKNNNINLAKENAYHLLECIDNLRIWDDETQTYRINTGAEEECKKRLNYYFKQKNGKDIEEDLNCVIHKMYYNESTYKALEETLISKIDKVSGDTDKILGPWKTVLPKTYLSADHEETLITFSSPKLVTLRITDELCEEYSKNYNKIKEKPKGLER